MFEPAPPYTVREGRRSQAARQPQRSQMSAVDTGQMSAAETGQMPAVETGEMSSDKIRQVSSVARADIILTFR